MEYPYMPLETPVGQPPTDEYSGDSLEDFYEYLLTPRHQMERSGQGAITHYGPSRYASVSDEDAKMAEFIMQQMNAQDEREFAGSVRESELGRRQAADEMMIPEGQGGGSMTRMTAAGAPAPGSAPTRFGPGSPRPTGPGMGQDLMIGGGMPQGPPPGPPATLTEGQGIVAAGGAYTEPRSTAARAQGEGYPDRTGPQGPTMSDRDKLGKIQWEKDQLKIAIGEISRKTKGWENLGWNDVVTAAREDPNSVPDAFRGEVEAWIARDDQLQLLMGGSGDRRWPGPPAPGGG
jgi:hypothetical protein